MAETEKPVFEIVLNGRLMLSTKWPPQAQAAWVRATRDRDSAHHGGTAVLLKNGKELAKVQPETVVGHDWPDRSTPEPDLSALARAITGIAKNLGYEADEIAASMTNRGLETTRSQLDALRGSGGAGKKRRTVSVAELIVLCDAIVNLLKTEPD